MPAASALRMPSSPSACTATRLRLAAASATAVRSSSAANCGSSQLSVNDVMPPVVHTLMKSAPAISSVRTSLRISSGPSHTPLGSQARFCSRTPAGTQESPCPPVCEIMTIEIEKTRAVDESVGDRFAKSGIGTAHVARGGHAAGERLLQDVG